MKRKQPFVLIVIIILSSKFELAAQSEYLEFSRPGIELNANFEINRKDNLDFGVNYLFTGSYIKNDTFSNILLFGRDFGTFQFGPSLTFNPIKVEGERVWRMALGFTYTQFVDFYGLNGLSTRIKGITVFNGDHLLLDNVGLKCEFGLSILSVINLYYGYTFPIKEYNPYTFRGHSITLTFNLNMSFFAYGLQGM